MPSHLVLESLRRRINALEEGQRRFLRAVPIADSVDQWLPHHGLSAGCIHEIKGASLASAIAFSAILSSRLAGDQGTILYIASDKSLYPLGLLPFGVRLDRFLHVSAKRPQDLAWAVMEALRCSQVSAVMALLNGLDLTESRRLQLAAESSGTTGFLMGHAGSAPIASSITRWSVSSITGKPGQRLHQPLWKLNLLYCRGGRPGTWLVEWRDQKLNAISAQSAKLVTREALAG